MSGDIKFKIDWASKSELRGPNERSLGDLIRKLRDRLTPDAQGISITYVDDRGMRKLNRLHRGINQTTDILSFPSNAEKGAFQHLGDLVISLPAADKMAEKLGVSRRREVETLIIHGFLHLCGYDHETDQGQMLELQAQLEKEFLEEEPLPMSLKRGRKTGSKVKVLKDGTRVVVTGRAAKAIERQAAVKKAKATEKVVKTKTRKPKEVPAEAMPKRGPGRPPKVKTADAPKAAPRKVARRKRPATSRSGIIA